MTTPMCASVMSQMRVMRVMLGGILSALCLAMVVGGWTTLWVEISRASEPALLAEIPAARLPPSNVEPQRRAIPPRNTGPAAMAHSRYRRGRHGTVRIIHRTPAVMREDAARVKRGDLFSTWSNEYLE